MSQLALQLIEKEKQERTGILDLGNCGLNEIPNSLFELSHLEELILSNAYYDVNRKKRESPNKGARNHISHLPKAFSKLIRLKRLYCGGWYQRWRISDISYLEKLSGLQSLYLSSNQISDISFLEKLTDLQNLNLSDNQISDITPLTLLIKKGIKITLKRFDSGLNLYKNPIVQPPLEFVEQGNEAILSYYDSLKGKKGSLKEIKILLIGEGMAGKTSLLKSLKGLPFEKHESQTHGVTIETLELGELDVFKPFNSLSDVIGRFWDFGGQEIMHASHQFFMTNRSLYILVLDSRTDAKKDYWLKHIQKFGGDSPVIIAINKIDDNKSYAVEQKTLNKKYPFIENRFHRISCKTGEGIEGLAKTIAETIPETSLFKTILNEDWIKVKVQLEEETAAKNYIDEDRYKQICIEHNVNDRTAQNTLLEFLNALGIVLHFKKLDLSNIFVLDPHWVTIGVYNIINSQLIPNGIFHENLLDTILNKEEIKKEEYDPAKDKKVHYSPLEQSYLLKIMQQFELLYEFREGEYLVPDLLPKEPATELEIDKADSDHIQFILEYDFLPNSIMSRFIIQMKNDIFNMQQLWRTGVLLKDATTNTKAFVQADIEEKRITICVAGDDKHKRDYFAVIRHTLTSINKSFQGLEVKRLVPLPDVPDITYDYDELIGLEKMGKDELNVGRLGKTYSISRDLLDKIISKSDRLKEGEQLDYPKHSTSAISESKPIYEYHWIKSLGKAFLVAIPIVILIQILNHSKVISFDYAWEIGLVSLCISALFFISGDPKYKFLRFARWSIGMIGIINILPALNSQFKWTNESEEGNFDFLFQLGIQDNWLVSLILFVVAMYLLYLQRDSEIKGK